MPFVIRILQAAYELGLSEKYVEAAALFEEVRSMTRIEMFHPTQRRNRPHFHAGDPAIAFGNTGRENTGCTPRATVDPTKLLPTNQRGNRKIFDFCSTTYLALLASSRL